jgi:hypothetical protein
VSRPPTLPHYRSHPVTSALGQLPRPNQWVNGTRCRCDAGQLARRSRECPASEEHRNRCSGRSGQSTVVPNPCRKRQGRSPGASGSSSSVNAGLPTTPLR